jgi:hypothetical protein
LRGTLPDACLAPDARPPTLEYSGPAARPTVRQWFNVFCGVVAAVIAIVAIAWSIIIFYYAFTGFRVDFGATACPASVLLLTGLVFAVLAWRWIRRAFRPEEDRGFIPGE